MKKIVVMGVSMLIFFQVAKAQTTQGTVSVGGSFQVSTYKDQNYSQNFEYSSSSVEFNPIAGYFIKDNLEVGVQLGISTSQAKIGTNDPSRGSSFAMGPFARYYKFTSNEKFAFTVQAGLLFGSGKSSPPNGNDTKTSSFTMALSPGFSYFITPKWGLDLSLQGISYSSYDPNKDVDNNKRSSFVFGVDSFSPSLGFRYFISR
ncbi:MAG: porin family protein [Cyclobacteriaceae bacterium]|nr:porin family protein [Cyclobacteriaceae bacterium]